MSWDIVARNSVAEVRRPLAAPSPWRVSKLCSASAARSCRSRFGAERASPISQQTPTVLRVTQAGQQFAQAGSLAVIAGAALTLNLPGFSFRAPLFLLTALPPLSKSPIPPLYLLSTAPPPAPT